MSIVEYALKFIGKPYVWAGNGPTGFDCSGLVIECLQAFGKLPAGDWSADTLSAKLVLVGWKPVSDVQEGDLLFYGSKKFTHVAMAINDWQVVEAGGGGSRCISPETSTGIVRVRPLTWRRPNLILRENKETLSV